MATVTKPIALNESFNTTEATPRNIADVLAEGIGDLIHAVSQIAPQTTYDLDDLGDVDITSPSNGQVLKYNGTSQKWENGTGGGSGDSVSWSQIQQSGTKIAQITINGTSTDVYAPTGGGGFSALIIITADAGQTVTATKGGDTYTATEVTSGTYEVTVDSAGTWTISDGTISDTIAIPSSGTYYVTLSSIPDGKTVTPTDDVQILLACAGITDKSYTMISELLADSVSLATVISDNNAIDYLVRSTTWASSVTSNSTAMSYIGLNNYASNTLLGDATWCSAILQSSNRESVLNVKVPVMTSETTPSGQCFESSVGLSNGVPTYYGYYAFDGKYYATGTWESSSASVPQYVGYKFPSAVCIKGIMIHNGRATYYGIKDFKFQGSNDGTNWTDLKSGTALLNTDYQYFSVENNTNNYQWYRVYNTSIYGSLSACNCQFYGRADV